MRRTRQQRVLLLLDNFEQVIAAAPAVADLLADCGRLSLLVTSREALRVSAEQLFPVQPLSLPNLSRHASAEQLADSEAVQLFVKRATAVAPKFRLTDQNAGAVAEICLRVDGLPLAIELAAARINLLSPEALRSRLGSGLQLLRHGARDAPARQQTLRATLEWSYQLLQPAEQRLFEMLSVFSGAGIDAIEEVSSSSNPCGGTEIEIVDGVVSLLDKNLIRMAEPEDGEPRVAMLETMREYAAERLDKQPEFGANTRRAHAAYYAAFARRQWEELAGEGREAALAALAANSENLRLAWRYWIGEADLSQLDALVDSVWRLYDSRGWYDATIELTNELLTVMASAPRTAERAMREVTLRTSLARALLARHGYTSEVEQAYTRALALFEEEQEPPSCSRSFEGSPVSTTSVPSSPRARTSGGRSCAWPKRGRTRACASTGISCWEAASRCTTISAAAWTTSTRRSPASSHSINRRGGSVSATTPASRPSRPRHSHYGCSATPIARSYAPIAPSPSRPTWSILSPSPTPSFIPGFSTCGGASLNLRAIAR